MSNLSREALQILRDFDEKYEQVTPEMVSTLKECIESSPVLVEQMNRAVTERRIKKLVLLEEDFTAGAAYDGDTSLKAIKMPLAKLCPSDKNKESSSRDMVFVLGHEIQHSFNYEERQREVQKAVKEMRDIAKDTDPINCYDHPVERWQSAARKDEASATLSGWNAAVSQLRESGAEVSLASMLKNYPGRASDFVDEDPVTKQVTPKPGLDFNPDLSISLTPGNVAAMGKYYYDNPNKTVGFAGSTYPNYTGATAMGMAAYIDRRYVPKGQDSKFVIDLQRHKMQEDKLEMNGIDLRLNIAKAPRQPYYQTGSDQVPAGYLDQTRDARVSAQQVHQYVPVALETDPSLKTGLARPDHPDHVLYTELKQRLPPETSEDRMAQITLAARQGGVRAGQVDQIVVQDEAVFVTGKAPGDWAKVNLAEPPISQQDAMWQMDNLDQQKSQQVAQWQQQGQQQNQQQAHHGL